LRDLFSNAFEVGPGAYLLDNLLLTKANNSLMKTLPKNLGVTSASSFLAAISILLLLLCSTVARADQIVYDDALENGWQDWGVANHNYSLLSPVHSGSYSVLVDMENPFDFIRINLASPISSTPYESLSFWINGDTQGGQQLWLRGVAAGGSFFPVVPLAAPIANTWTHMTVSLSDLGVANRSDFEGIVFQNRTSVAQPIFLLDDIQLVSIPEPTAFATLLVGFLCTLLRTRPGRS